MSKQLLDEKKVNYLRHILNVCEEIFLFYHFCLFSLFYVKTVKFLKYINIFEGQSSNKLRAGRSSKCSYNKGIMSELLIVFFFVDNFQISI